MLLIQLVVVIHINLLEKGNKCCQIEKQKLQFLSCRAILFLHREMNSSRLLSRIDIENFLRAVPLIVTTRLGRLITGLVCNAVRFEELVHVLCDEISRLFTQLGCFGRQTLFCFSLVYLLEREVELLNLLMFNKGHSINSYLHLFLLFNLQLQRLLQCQHLCSRMSQMGRRCRGNLRIFENLLRLQLRIVDICFRCLVRAELLSCTPR